MKLESKGFTLTELMISVVIASGILYVVFVTTQAGNNQIDLRNAKMAIQDNAREGLYQMVQEIRQSAPLYLTIGSGETSANTIEFWLPEPGNLTTSDGTYTVNWNDAHVIQYAWQQGQIIRTDTTDGDTSVIANDVTGITFEGDSVSPNIVTITMNVQKQLRNNRWVPEAPLSLSAQAEIRNPSS